MIGRSCSTRLPDADVPVVEVDVRVAMAGDQADLVAEPEPVGGGRDGEAAALVGGALAAVIGVYEDVGAALQFGVNAARRLDS